MSIIYCIQVGSEQVCITHLIGATYWCQVALHVSHSNMYPATWLYHLACHLHGTPSATHTQPMLPFVLSTILVSITFSTDLMKPDCLSWWKLVCNSLFFLLMRNGQLYTSYTLHNIYTYVLAYILTYAHLPTYIHTYTNAPIHADIDCLHTYVTG